MDLKKHVRVFGVLLGLVMSASCTVAEAAVSYSQPVMLSPGWNIVSTPRLLDSHSFSAPETLSNFAIYTLDPTRPSGWATMSELGQTEFTPLYGYFILNKSTSTQTLTFRYKASTTPNERLFERKFTKEGWYAFGIANAAYAKPQGANLNDTDNPDKILNSLLGVVPSYDAAVDFTDASYPSAPDSVALKDPWKFRIRSADISSSTEINSLNDFRETKAYAIYIKATSTLTGYQDSSVPQCSDGQDNDGDSKIDYPADPGCAGPLDPDETNLPSGTLSLEKNVTYANQVTSVPQTAYKIGEYKLVVGSTDTYTVTGFDLDLSSSTISTGSLSGIYIDYGGQLTTAYATGSNLLTWSGNAGQVLPGSVISIKIFASLPLSAANGQTIKSSLNIRATSQNTGDPKSTGVVAGQTITVGTGTLTVALDASTPVAAQVVGNSMPKVASFKFTGSNDSFTITSLTATSSGSAAITELVFKDGSTEIGRVPFNGTVATMTGLSVAVPYNSNKVVDVYANLGGVGTGAASTGSNVGIALVAYERQNSNGVKTQVYNLGSAGSLAGNSFYAFKTKPTITNVALPTTVLTAGTMAVAKFTITADAGGAVAWRKLVLNYSHSGNFSLSAFQIYDAANESMPVAGVSIASTSNTITFTSSSTDQEVSGSKTYVVKAMITGPLVTGDSVSTNIAAGQGSFVSPDQYGTVAAGASTFVWSDESTVPHSSMQLTWNGDYLVKNLPTDSQALTK